MSMMMMVVVIMTKMAVYLDGELLCDIGGTETGSSQLSELWISPPGAGGHCRGHKEGGAEQVEDGRPEQHRGERHHLCPPPPHPPLISPL